jgi:hypothetical protein
LGSVSGDVRVKYRTQCNLTRKADGKLYLVPVDYDMEFEPQTMTAHFDNLFNGNKLLGKPSKHRAGIQQPSLPAV